VKAPGVIYRLGRKPDPWAPPDWASAGPDGTFGNRFDDPDATYRVLYASSQRLGCFVETLARFRIDPTLLAELPQIEGAMTTVRLGKCPWSGSRSGSWDLPRPTKSTLMFAAANGQPLAKVVGSPFEEVWTR
jgi:hypothetical protein